MIIAENKIDESCLLLAQPMCKLALWMLRLVVVGSDRIGVEETERVSLLRA